MKIIIAAAAALLAGCATAPQPTPEEYVAAQSNYDVCRLSLGSRVARAAEAEVARRRLDCTPFYGAISQQRAADSAAVQQILGRQQPAPVQVQPYRMPQPVNCTSQVVGNQVQTRCQ